MHPNPAFRGVEAERSLAFARTAGFGVLSLNGEEGPLISHLPFVMADDGASLAAHIVRSNPIWKKLRAGPAQAVMVVSGPHGYISPDWYGLPDQVPTWNYVAVHLRGTITLAPEDNLHSHLDDLSARLEGGLAPKPIWTMDKMNEDALSRMMRMIAPIQMQIASVDGTWKLNQNKEEAARHGAADGVAAQGMTDLADLMRKPPA